MPGLSLGLGLGLGGGPAYIPEANALFARMTGTPSAADKSWYDGLIGDLKTASLWSKHEILYTPAAFDTQASKLNLVADQDNLIAYGSPTFTQYLGVAGNGSTSYYDTQFVPSLSSKFLQNDAYIWVYINGGTNSASALRVPFGVLDTTARAYILPRYTGDIVAGSINAASTMTFAGLAATDRLGFTSLGRTGSTAATGRKGANTASSTTASSGRPALSMFLGGLNNNGSMGLATDDRIAAAGVCSKLTPTQEGTLKDIITARLTSIGAN